MKIGLISDLHFGVKHSDDGFFASQLKFLRERFLPALRKEQVDSVFILGDVFNDRKSISVKMLDATTKFFRDEMAEFETHIIVGNHDMYLSTSTDVNSVNCLSYLSPNIHVHLRVERVGDFLMVPWLDKTNLEEARRYLASPDRPPYALGHLETPGFGTPEDETRPEPSADEWVAAFKRTFSGHIHTPGVKTMGDNEYRLLGAPWQLTRADRDGARGAYIYDTEMNSLEFIENDVSAKFVEIRWPEEPNADLITGNMVDVLVDSAEFSKAGEEFDAWMKRINELKPLGEPVVQVVKANEEKFEVAVENKTMRQVLSEYLATRTDLDPKDRASAERELESLLAECEGRS